MAGVAPSTQPPRLTLQELVIRLNRLQSQVNYIATPYRQLQEDLDFLQRSLVNLVQELQAENDRLRKDNERIERENTQLKMKLKPEGKPEQKKGDIKVSEPRGHPTIKEVDAKA